MRESKLRTIIKTISFKILTTSATALILGSLGTALLLHVVMTLIYIIHERVWNRIDWQKTKVN
jgi:uncharacterized membrane protein